MVETVAKNTEWEAKNDSDFHKSDTGTLPTNLPYIQIDGKRRMFRAISEYRDIPCDLCRVVSGQRSATYSKYTTILLALNGRHLHLRAVALR